MSSISMESALAISKKHKMTDQIESFTQEYSPTQSCAVLILEYARSLQEKKDLVTEAHGAKIKSFTISGEQRLMASCADQTFFFEEIPKVVLAALCCHAGNCHKNCINACAGGLPANAIIHTSEVDTLGEGQTGLAGVLHSYVQLGETIFDLSHGIRMNKTVYDKLFNVKEISSVEARLIKADIADKTISRLSEKGVFTEVYLMARDDCAKSVAMGK